jgi:hypothetical protein
MGRLGCGKMTCAFEASRKQRLLEKPRRRLPQGLRDFTETRRAAGVGLGCEDGEIVSAARLLQPHKLGSGGAPGRALTQTGNGVDPVRVCAESHHTLYTHSGSASHGGVSPLTTTTLDKRTQTTPGRHGRQTSTEWRW